MSRRFAGQVALVTGASMGIGKKVALAFAKEGADVAVVDRNWSAGESVVEEIRAFGNARFFSCDVRSPEDIESTIQSVVDVFGQLNCVCNNAGIEGDPGTSTTECTIENWDKVIAVNLKGVWLCMKYEIPEMLKAGKGAIVNISSIAGLVGFPGIPAYVASKHGIIGLTRNAALEYATQGIRVNAVCPGGIDTPMLHRFTQGDQQKWRQMADMHPMGRVGDPQEIANAVLWLCSDEASFVTGQALAVDGGYVAR